MGRDELADGTPIDRSTPVEVDADTRKLLSEAWGALNFILAFYEPGQRYLDTEAWKNAEASGRRVHAKLRAYLDALPADGFGHGNGSQKGKEG